MLGLHVSSSEPHCFAIASVSANDDKQLLILPADGTGQLLHHLRTLQATCGDYNQ